MGRQWLRGLFVAAALTGCQEPPPPVGEIGAVSGFIGGVVAEEPNAALVARDVLSSGGTAADAVVAAFFAMSVTYPAGVGLGGGGACVYYDALTNTAEALEFLPRAPANGGSVSVPGAVRGMALLHSRYGRLKWNALLSPAETLARFGFPVSRALATQVAAAQTRLFADPRMTKLLLTEEGRPLVEGETLIQVELAAALSSLRTRGVGDLYGGELGRRLVDEARSAGGLLELADLRGFTPRWQPPADRKVGSHLLHHPPATAAGLAVYALTGAMENQSAETATATAFPPNTIHRPNAGQAAVVAADPEGSSVACVFTMHGAFGIGKAAPTTGILLAAAAAPGGVQLAPLVVANHNTGQTFFAAAASGGPAGVAAAARVTMDVMERGQGLRAALTQARSFRFDTGQVLINELADPGDPRRRLGRVQALHCPEGLKRKPELCVFATDPRGHGLSAAEIF